MSVRQSMSTSVSLRIALHLFILVRVCFQTSEAKLRVSVPYSSSKNYAFPALCPTWKIETVGTSVFTNCIRRRLAVYLVCLGRHLHPWLVSVILSKHPVCFFWGLPASRYCEVGPARLGVASLCT